MSRWHSRYPDNVIADDVAHAVVSYKDGGSVWVDESCYTEVLRQWMNGDTFTHAIGMYGQQVTIKLREVEQISFWDDAAIAEETREREIQRQREMLRGDDA